MKDTVDTYYKKYNLYDISLISNYGITNADITLLKNEGYDVEASYEFDVIVKKEEEYAVKVLSYNKNSKINQLVLKEGRLPIKNNECVIEKVYGYKIGDMITVESDELTNKELTIVGIVNSPIYISRERGTTKLLSGTINYFLYTPITNFNRETYTQAYLDINTNENISVFSKKYINQINKEINRIEKITNNFGVENYKKIKENLEKQKISIEEKINELDLFFNNSRLSLLEKEEIEQKKELYLNTLNKLNKEYNYLSKPKTYVLDIYSNLGFNNYDKDAERIDNVAKVFPIVFFVVAILICLTTMTRMVEEERVQIGTLKSLGYTDFKIMSKYLLYALLATLIGSIIGVLIGFNIIPKVIFNMYSMMYVVEDFQSNFNVMYALIGTVIAILCTLGATYYTCYKTLKEVPANLLRPKSPKSGKRVFLEKIPFIWRKLKFTKKVTIRNVFRYKKRFLMTIIGISGCTGLILAGFGIKDCITNMVPNQYESIYNYEVEVTLKDVSYSEKEVVYNSINLLEEVKKSLKLEIESIELENYKTKESILLIVPFGEIKDYIDLRNRKTGEKYSLGSGITITEKITQLLNLKNGNNIEFSIDGDKKYNLKIDNITENYLMHYVYMSKDIYNSDNYNTIFLKTKSMNTKEEKEFASKLKKIENISSLTFNSSTKNIFDDTMKNFAYVSIVLIISAGLLAFVVLYSLESVNISERKRELASLKVLGFYDKEVYNYISRETIILSTIGMMLGIFVGIFLTKYIMKTCELDMIMFDSKINFISYIYSLGITLIFMLFVKITTYYSLKKINMIESLKSVE